MPDAQRLHVQEPARRLRLMSADQALFILWLNKLLWWLVGCDGIRFESDGNPFERPVSGITRFMFVAHIDGARSPECADAIVFGALENPVQATKAVYEFVC